MQLLLLCFKHRLILEVGHHRSVEEQLRHLFVVDTEIACISEEVVGGHFRFWREQMVGPDRNALAAIALRCATASLSAADIEIDYRWGFPRDHLPAIDISGKIAGTSKQRRWLHVNEPSTHVDSIARPLSLYGKCSLARISSQRLGVKVNKVCEVDEVVDDQLVIGADMKIARRESPGRIVQPREVWNFGFVGASRVSHPDPGHPPLLAHHVAANGGTRRNGLLTRHFNATSGAIEFQPVIATLQMFAD